MTAARAPITRPTALACDDAALVSLFCIWAAVLTSGDGGGLGDGGGGFGGGGLGGGGLGGGGLGGGGLGGGGLDGSRQSGISWFPHPPSFIPKSPASFLQRTAQCSPPQQLLGSPELQEASMKLGIKLP